MEIFPDIIGYIGSLFIIAGFILNGEVKIRVINCIAAMIFVAYSIIIGAMPMVLLNGVIPFIHAYKIYRFKQNEKATKTGKAEVAANENPGD